MFKYGKKNAIGKFIYGVAIIGMLFGVVGAIVSFIGLSLQLTGGDYSGWMIMGVAENPASDLIILFVLSLITFVMSLYAGIFAEEKLMDENYKKYVKKYR